MSAIHCRTEERRKDRRRLLARRLTRPTEREGRRPGIPLILSTVDRHAHTLQLLSVLAVGQELTVGVILVLSCSPRAVYIV
jgi:hypothetical protein